MKLLPDVSHEARAIVKGELYRVGMDSIEMPICLDIPQVVGKTLVLPAKVSALVSLDKPEAKGIHMSRLYLKLKESLPSKPLSFQLISKLLREFVESQNGLSESSEVQFQFELPVERKALLSGETGWRQYQVGIHGIFESGQVKFYVSGAVKYSSTCPCSAALARQLVKEKFAEDFSGKSNLKTSQVEEWLELESSIVATPHAQRSLAEFKIQLTERSALDLIGLLDGVEQAIGTPVQAAVKRQDEQEFAKLNGSNLMFCEDAGRKLQSYFENQKEVLDYQAKLSHFESLHPHNAVCHIRKLK